MTATMVGVGSMAWLAPGGAALAQEAGDADHPAKKRPKKPAKAEKPSKAEKAEKAETPPAPAPAAAPDTAAAPPAAAPGATPTAASPGLPDFSGRLKQAGAGSCGDQVNALAAGTMSGVTQFGIASNWANGDAGKRLVNLSLGQHYPDGGSVTAAATNVIASPNPQGSCDAVSVQVVPSPLPCAKIRENMSTNGKQIGDLAGVLLMQDGTGQTMLVPTAANTCVLVGTRIVYAK